MTKLEGHILYFRPTCPYCVKVLSFMDGAGIELELRNIQDAAIARELVAIGGKQQVPCLVVDGKALYESDDIIAYLRQVVSD